MSPPAATPAQSQWLRIGWLIDGLGGPVQHNVAMAVHDGRIAAIGPDIDAGAGALDFSRVTVLPALMDAHVHLAFSGTEDPQARNAQLNAAPEAVRAVVTRHLRDQWQCGVVAVRDGGDRGGEVLHCKRHCPPPVEQAITVFSPGWAWHAFGRYGTMIGRHPQEGQTLADALAPHLPAIDHLKLLQSGINSLARCGPQGGPQFSETDLRAAIRAAHAAGKPVMVHANGDIAVRMALEAGCDSIEHGYFMGPGNLRRMADQLVTWVPTAIPMAALAQAQGLTQQQKDIARRTLDHQLDQIRQANDLGVPIALGTDAGGQGVHHGHAVRQELRLLMTAGLSLSQAIRCATRNAAYLMGLQDRGALTPGHRADFIAVPGPPDRLPEGLATIQSIQLSGRSYEPTCG